MATPKRRRASSEATGEGHQRGTSSEVESKRGRRAASLNGSGSDDSLETLGRSTLTASQNTLYESEFRFSVEVIQQPRRARACGFGDKDHRPLSPIPIIRLRVYRRDGSEVKADDVDTSCLVLCLDLWSGDGTSERNVVRHPPSAAAHRRSSPEPRQPSGSSSAFFPSGPNSSGWPGTVPAESSPSSAHAASNRTVGFDAVTSRHFQGALSPSTSRSHFVAQRQQSFAVNQTEWSSTNARADGTRPVTAPSSFGRPFGRPTLPLLSQISDAAARARSHSLAGEKLSNAASHSNTLSPILEPTRRDSGQSPTTASSLAPTDYSFLQSFGRRLHESKPSSSGSTEGSWMTDTKPLSATIPGPSGWGPSHNHRSFSHSDSVNSSSSRPSTADLTGRTSTSSSSRQSAASQLSILLVTPSSPSMQPAAPSVAGAPIDEPIEDGGSSESSTPSDDGSFSRVLVGLLGETCCKLQDEESVEGLFFFPRTLGVRTEGTFALKCTLVQFEPEPAAGGEAIQKSRVLAHCQTDAFEVFPAKRFPGVCPLTDMTRHFSRQGIRLPMRRKVIDDGAEEDAGDEGEDDLET